MLTWYDRETRGGAQFCTLLKSISFILYFLGPSGCLQYYSSLHKNSALVSWIGVCVYSVISNKTYHLGQECLWQEAVRGAGRWVMLRWFCVEQGEGRWQQPYFWYRQYIILLVFWCWEQNISFQHWCIQLQTLNNAKELITTKWNQQKNNSMQF